MSDRGCVEDRRECCYLWARFGDVGGDVELYSAGGKGRYDVFVSKSRRRIGTATTRGRLVITRILPLLF
jgi:hypothetical protein